MEVSAPLWFGQAEFLTQQARQAGNLDERTCIYSIT
jgi:hypothetical protein